MAAVTYENGVCLIGGKPVMYHLYTDQYKKFVEDNVIFIGKGRKIKGNRVDDTDRFFYYIDEEKDWED